MLWLVGVDIGLPFLPTSKPFVVVVCWLKFNTAWTSTAALSGPTTRANKAVSDAASWSSYDVVSALVVLAEASTPGADSTLPLLSTTVTLLASRLGTDDATR